MIVLWLIFGGLTAIIAEAKGFNSLIWGAAGVLFGVFALIAVLIVPSQKKGD